MKKHCMIFQRTSTHRDQAESSWSSLLKLIHWLSFFPSQLTLRLPIIDCLLHFCHTNTKNNADFPTRQRWQVSVLLNKDTLDVTQMGWSWFSQEVCNALEKWMILEHSNPTKSKCMFCNGGITDGDARRWGKSRIETATNWCFREIVLEKASAGFPMNLVRPHTSMIWTICWLMRCKNERFCAFKRASQGLFMHKSERIKS